MALDAVGRKSAIDDLLNKVALVMEVMDRVMKDGEHYGKIPGCGDKPALLKAGAEKLGMTFRLHPSFDITERDLGRAHREYSIKCRLSDGTEGVGSCSTMESKFRFRGGERKCPECGKAAIIKGKAEYGGGWLCFQKKGGCGHKWPDGAAEIESQSQERVEHDNPADYYNTCLKMGKKRAHVDAIITATACSDIFVQDVEEMVGQADASTPRQAAAPAPAAAPPAKAPEKPKPASNRAPIDAEQVFPVCSIKMVTERSGTKADGKPWHAHFVLFNDGFSDVEAGTFSMTVGKMAQSLSESDQQCEITVKPGKKAGTLELVSLIPKGEPIESDNVPMDFNSVPEVTP